DALAEEDFAAMGEALRREWSARRRLAPVVSTPLIDRAIASAVEAGAWGGKACGAGGGGGVGFLSPHERAADVRAALQLLGEGRVLPIQPVNEGLRVTERNA